jgi:Dihaem cytochrome c
MKAAIALALLGLAATVRAEVPPQPLLPAYRAECGACHVAYPPALLPAASWTRLMAGLDRHFGSDATLDPATAKAIGDWLAANAGRGGQLQRAAAPPEDRITRSAWFLREHDEVSPATWKRPDVKGPSNCQACHRQAERGDFSERQLRVPR